jgi:hypothetical protein
VAAAHVPDWAGAQVRFQRESRTVTVWVPKAPDNNGPTVVQLGAVLQFERGKHKFFSVLYGVSW